MVPPFLATLVVLAAIFLMTQMLDLTDLVVNHHVGAGAVGLLLLYGMPFLLQFVLPMATMMGVLLAFLRLSSDNEVVALKSAGASLYQLLPAVLIFCLLTMGLTAAVSVKGLPWGRRAASDLVIDVARKNIELGVRERTFNDTFKRVVLYVNEVDEKTRRLRHVFIEDRRRKGIVLTIVAEEGELLSNPGHTVWQLRLKNGMADQVDVAGETVYTLHFDTYDFRVDLSSVLAARQPGDLDEEEMTLAQLRDFLESREKRDDRYYLALLEWHKKFSMPFACVVLGILGIPLGIVSRSARRSFGVGLGLCFFLLYYLLLSAGWVFGESGVYPPLAGMWVPNIVLGAVALGLLHRAATDRPVRTLELARRAFTRIIDRLARRRPQ